jgi:hypothetical protein
MRNDFFIQRQILQDFLDRCLGSDIVHVLCDFPPDGKVNVVITPVQMDPDTTLPDYGKPKRLPLYAKKGVKKGSSGRSTVIINPGPTQREVEGSHDYTL